MIDQKQMKKESHDKVPYANAIDNLIYAMLSTRTDIRVVGMVGRFQSNRELVH